MNSQSSASNPFSLSLLIPPITTLSRTRPSNHPNTQTQTSISLHRQSEENTSFVSLDDLRRLRLEIAALQAQISAIRLQHEDELREICVELRSSVVPPAQQPVPQTESQPVPQSTSQQETPSDQQPVTQSDSLPTSPPILCPAPEKMKKKT